MNKESIHDLIHYSVALIEKSINITFQLMKFANSVTKTWFSVDILT